MFSFDLLFFYEPKSSETRDGSDCLRISRFEPPKWLSGSKRAAWVRRESSSLRYWLLVDNTAAVEAAEAAKMRSSRLITFLLISLVWGSCQREQRFD